MWTESTQYTLVTLKAEGDIWSFIGNYTVKKSVTSE